MTSCFVDVFPADITISMVIAVCALNGEEYRPTRYLIASSPAGEQVSAMQFEWQWEDDPDIPVKYRVFAQQLPVRVECEGTYTLGLYPELNATDPEQSYPLQVSLTPADRR